MVLVESLRAQTLWMILFERSYDMFGSGRFGLATDAPDVPQAVASRNCRSQCPRSCNAKDYPLSFWLSNLECCIFAPDQHRNPGAHPGPLENLCSAHADLHREQGKKKPAPPAPRLQRLLHAGNTVEGVEHQLQNMTFNDVGARTHLLPHPMG